MHTGLNLHLSNYHAGLCLKEHVHDETLFCLVIGGSYQETIRSRVSVHGQGDLLVCPHATPHAQQIGNMGARKLIFAPAQMSLEYLAGHGIRLDQAPFSRAGHFLQLGTRLMHELQNDDPYTNLAREGLVLELIAAFARANENSTQSGVPAWLKTARDYINAHYEQNITLEQLAHEVRHHPVHLAREFKRHYGLTIGDYQRRARVELAARLLREGKLPLSEIALTCGFASHANLCRTFKAAYAMTPSVYRLQFW
ncbi:helix-turn-helix transcriptional regulator [Undibacterium sp. Ji50W]|uniref:helix-turn-helix transcriptional regulator n=1 Tax=Undibacterium sp. Ji50W TaxID=3413041 RepID=UPI003BF1CE43